MKSLGVLLALALVAVMLAAACADDEGDGDTGGNGGNGAAEETPADGGDATPEGEDTPDEGNGEPAAGAGGTIALGYVAGWDEGVAATYLWQHLLEEEGYEVELTAAEIGTVFAGVAQGDLDAYMDAWLPATHSSYEEQFGDQWVDLGTWYEPADLFLTVPSYVDVDSLAELSENAEQFNSTITGIEAGAGMMEALRESVMPAYGLDDWTLLESNTSSMLAELDSAIQNEEPIVVTLWSPGWWYGEYDLKNLEDPDEAWPEPDSIKIVGREGFEEDFSQVAEWWGNFEMSDDQLSDLEVMIREAGDENIEQAVSDWVSENEDAVQEWVG